MRCRRAKEPEAHSAEYSLMGQAVLGGGIMQVQPGHQKPHTQRLMKAWKASSRQAVTRIVWLAYCSCYKILLTFKEEFLSGSTTTFTLKGGLKSYVLLHAPRGNE